MSKDGFIEYVHDFYGPESDLYPMGATVERIAEALEILIARGDDVSFDSIDREKVRDIMIAKFKLVFPPAPLNELTADELIANFPKPRVGPRPPRQSA